MTLFKKIRKIFFWFVGLFAVVIIASSIALYLYKDQIIDLSIAKANEYINTPIEVNHIDLNIWDKFPSVSLSFESVTIQESWTRSTDPLLIAEHIYVLLNPLDLVMGNLEVSQIYFSNAQFNIKVNREGIPNYRILKEGVDSKDSLVFQLEKIVLENCSVNYLDYRSRQDHQYYTSYQEAKISFDQNQYLIQAKGDVLVKLIKIDGKDYVNDKQVNNVIDLTVNSQGNLFTINTSEIEFNNSKFSVQGTVTSKDENSIALQVKGIETNIQTLLSLIPEKSVKKFKSYRSSGDIYFTMKLDGVLNKEVRAVADFGMREVQITHPETGIRFEQINLKGKLEIPSLKSPETMTIILESLKGMASNQEFEGSLIYKNLTNPHLQFNVQGAMLVSDLVKIIDNEKINSGTGRVSGSISFKGALKDIKSLQTIDKIQANGSIKLDNVSLEFKNNYPPPTSLTGSFEYKMNDLIVTNFNIEMGSSHWEMTGVFKNLIPYFVSDDQNLRIEATISEGNLVLDEFLQPTDQPRELEFAISDKLNIDVRVNLNNLSLNRFKASDIKGQVKINNQMAFIKDLTFHSMGGSLKFNSLINTRDNLIRINNTTILEKIDIDSVFYVYDNFGQSWLKSDNLKGQVNADVLTDMVFDQNLEFYGDSLIADISIEIHNGELNDFEPMKKLEKFVDEDLSRLVFSELKNDIHIENRTIYIPNMEVRNNVSNLQISGTHTFDQHIEYHVVVPLRKLQSRNDKMFGAIEDDGSGSKLHLIIAGTTSDYSIEYDTKAVGKKIVADLKKEVNELKNAFKKKEKITEEITLNEDEYFEWDEDTTSYKKN